MRDGKTNNLASSAEPSPGSEFLSRHRASLVIIRGDAPRTRIPLERIRTVIGRGDDADVTVPDPAMSNQHFALEVGAHSVRVLDLGSTNGIALNGKVVAAAELGHGDRVRAGNHEFQFVVEEVEREPPAPFAAD